MGMVVRCGGDGDGGDDGGGVVGQVGDGGVPVALRLARIRLTAECMAGSVVLV